MSDAEQEQRQQKQNQQQKITSSELTTILCQRELLMIF